MRKRLEYAAGALFIAAACLAGCADTAPASVWLFPIALSAMCVICGSFCVMFATHCPEDKFKDEEDEDE